MKKMLLTISLAVLLIFSGIAGAACPSADLTGNCFVDLEDFAIMASQWLMGDEPTAAFITTWNTNLGTGTTVTLTLDGTVNATLDWGDGSSVYTVTTPGQHTHDYGSDGIYTVSVTGSVEEYSGGLRANAYKLISVDSWGQLGFTSMHNAFDECINLVSVPNTSVGIETVTDMSGMFYFALSFNQDLSNWDTSNVTDMSEMFSNAYAFNGNIGNWDTSNVTDMNEMFTNAYLFNQNISNWDTSSVTDMSKMFSTTSAFNQDISDWNTSSVTNMLSMFSGAGAFNQDISGWVTSSVTDMSRMFSGASAFNQDISNWDTSSVIGMGKMFSNASAFNQDLSGWCVTNITSKPTDFDTDAASWILPQPIWGTCPPPAFKTKWDTSKGAGTTVTLALAGAVNVTIDWGDGNVEHITTQGPVHTYSSEGIYTVSVTGSATMYDSYNYGGGTSERDKLISVDNWGQLGFTSMSAAFDHCTNLVSVPRTSEGIEAVTNMTYMFFDAWSFNGNIDGWDTSNVTNMGWMFYNASSFNQDLSGWCVTNIPTGLPSFDYGASSWTLPRPNWGTCP
ncbi:MAG: BspA family leucine-rich repeat surface protein [Phycisphaerae bacterium]|nr:BspA family leucine-rich repeat surface protein [Phycisphaerae bacterium]